MTDRPELLVHKAGMAELNHLLTLHFELVGVVNSLHDMEDEEIIDLLSSIAKGLRTEHEAFTSLVLMFASLAQAVSMGSQEIFLEHIIKTLEGWK